MNLVLKFFEILKTHLYFHHFINLFLPYLLYFAFYYQHRLKINFHLLLQQYLLNFLLDFKIATRNYFLQIYQIIYIQAHFISIWFFNIIFTMDFCILNLFINKNPHYHPKRSKIWTRLLIPILIYKLLILQIIQLSFCKYANQDLYH